MQPSPRSAAGEGHARGGARAAPSCASSSRRRSIARPCSLAQRDREHDRVVRQGQEGADGGTCGLVVLVPSAIRERAVAADLVQEGNIGPHEAVDRFQYRRGSSSRPTRRCGSDRRSREPSRTTRARSASRCTWWDAQRISRLNRSLVNEMGAGAHPGGLAQRTRRAARKVRLILESSRKPLSLETRPSGRLGAGDFLETRGRVAQRQPHHPGPDPAGGAGAEARCRRRRRRS